MNVATVLPAGLPRQPKGNVVHIQNKATSTVALCNFSTTKETKHTKTNQKSADLRSLNLPRFRFFLGTAVASQPGRKKEASMKNRLASIEFILDSIQWT